MPRASAGVIGAVMDTTHAATHEGRMFGAAYSATIGSDKVAEVVFTIPVGVHCHMRARCRAEKAATFEVLSNVTPLGGGTAITAHNRSMPSSRASGVTDIKGGSPDPISSGGVVKWPELVGVAGAGASLEPPDETILTSGQSHAFRVTSHAGANQVSITLAWYEAAA